MTAEVIGFADFRRKRASPEPQREIAPIPISEAIEICLQHSEHLTCWEERFLASIRHYDRLSPKQLVVLQRIFDAICRMVEGPLR